MEPARTESLLADLQWLQALARELVRDPEVADDAVQDVCVAALRHGGAVLHPRAWLATVLRNCLSLRSRGERRAGRRDAAIARGEATAGTGELVQRAELQQRLVGVVLQLPPQHRDVVLLRFFDGLPPRAISQRLQVPVATVHSRLQRALQQLRLLLDRDCGGRAHWAALFLTLPAVPAWTWPVLGALMQTKMKALLAVLVAVGTVTWWCSGNDGSAATAALGDAGKRSARPHGSGGGSGDDGGASGAVANERTRLPDDPASATAPAIARIAVQGRVCGCDGSGLPGVPVVVRGDSASATSDATGAFAIELLPRRASLTVDDERFVTVLSADWAPDTKVQPVLVVAPVLRVAGSVVDTQGGAVGRAHVFVQLPDDFDARFPVPLDRGERARWSAVTGADGRFSFARLPRIDGVTLLAAADALRPATVPMPTVDTQDLQIRLSPFAYEAGQIDGVVVDPQGAPVAGARVAMGVTSVVTDGDGRFALLLRRAGWPSAITAAKAGYLPGRLELPRNGGSKREDWPERVVLRLGGPPLSIAGHVRDQNDKPIEGALVWVADPTLLGIAGVLPLQTEYMLAGGELPAQAARMPVRFADDPTHDDMFLDQSSNAPQPTSCWFFTTSGKDGQFELPGLLARDYRVRAFDPTTGLGAEVGPVPAGAGTEVRIVRDGLWPELHGIVKSVRGEPVAGVDVAHRVRLFTANERVPGGRFEGIAVRDVERVRTGADGTFVLHDVHPQHAAFHFGGDAILPLGARATDVRDPRHFEVTVEARCHVEVALLDAAEADEIAATDRDGGELDISVLRAGSHQATTELQLHEGKSGVFVLGERAAWLLLRRGGTLVRKVALQLEPGKTFRVQ